MSKHVVPLIRCVKSLRFCLSIRLGLKVGVPVSLKTVCVRHVRFSNVVDPMTARELTAAEASAGVAHTVKPAPIARGGRTGIPIGPGALSRKAVQNGDRCVETLSEGEETEIAAERRAPQFGREASAANVVMIPLGSVLKPRFHPLYMPAVCIVPEHMKKFTVRPRRAGAYTRILGTPATRGIIMLRIDQFAQGGLKTDAIQNTRTARELTVAFVTPRSTLSAIRIAPPPS